LERLQKAEDIARAAIFLASIDAKEITGAALNVGGGVVMD
jgi:NAD(P)-dependent dehydrogenase (short-subunit alcohol dehydrogenase family)